MDGNDFLDEYIHEDLDRDRLQVRVGVTGPILQIFPRDEKHGGACVAVHFGPDLAALIAALQRIQDEN